MPGIEQAPCEATAASMSAVLHCRAGSRLTCAGPEPPASAALSGRAGLRPPEDPIALVHCRRDIALRKDVSPVRTGNAPQALAALWNTVLAGRPSPVGASLAAIREAFAENRLQTVATA